MPGAKKGRQKLPILKKRRQGFAPLCGKGTCLKGISLNSSSPTNMAEVFTMQVPSSSKYSCSGSFCPPEDDIAQNVSTRNGVSAIKNTNVLYVQ